MARWAVRARTPRSAPGSNAPSRRRPGRRLAAGFTLIELLLVVAIVAVASMVVSLAVRDPAASRLEQEAARLAALFESARAESRAAGVEVRWVLAGQDAGEGDFRFVGLPPSSDPQTRWLNPGVSAQIVGAPFVTLGPEPLIGAQRVVLRLGEQRLDLVTDGLTAFRPVPPDAQVPS